MSAAIANLLTNVLANLNWIAVVILMMIGLYIVMAHSNLVKKLIGLSVFQSSAFILFISLGKVDGGTAPITSYATNATTVFSHPLPHVLILTAIVVGVATTAVGLALVVRIYEAYNTIEERDVLKQDLEHSRRKAAAKGEAR